jgi:hypothetical protein
VQKSVGCPVQVIRTGVVEIARQTGFVQKRIGVPGSRKAKYTGCC